MLKYVLFLFVLLPFFCKGQGTSVPLSLFQQFNGHYDYTIIGKSHNPYDNIALVPQSCVMQTNSSASLNLAANQTIVGAYLVWSGIGNGGGTTLNLNGNSIIPDLIHVANIHPPTWTPILFFSAVKDITSYVQSFGSGLYQVSNFDLNPLISLYCSNMNYYSGWNLIVVYSNPTLPNKQLNIYDGFVQMVGTVVNNTTFYIPINNLNVTSTAGAKITYIAYNGSSNLYSGESVKFNNNVLSNAQNPANNPFNGTNSFTGSNTS